MFAFDCKLAPCFGIEDALIGSIVLMMEGMAQAVGYLNCNWPVFRYGRVV